MTIAELTHDFTEGTIILADAENNEYGTIPAQSLLLNEIGDKEVISWKAVATSSKVPKIVVICDLTPAP